MINMFEWHPLTADGRFLTREIREVRSSNMTGRNLATAQKQPSSSMPQTCAQLAEHRYFSLSLSIYLSSIYLSNYLSIYLSTYLFISLSIYLSLSFQFVRAVNSSLRNRE